MSSSDERILRSVDDVVEAVGRLLGEIRGAPDISDEKKDIAVEKAGEVASFLQDINSLLFAADDLDTDGAGAAYPDDEALAGEAVAANQEVVSPEPVDGDHAAGMKPSLIVTPVIAAKADDEAAVAALGDDDPDDQPVEDETVYEVNNLTLIDGIDDVVAAALNGLKVTSFRQIASFDEEDVQAVSGLINDPARVARENWIEQAALLMVDMPTHYAASRMDAAYFDRASLNEAYSVMPVKDIDDESEAQAEPEAVNAEAPDVALIQSERDLLEAELASLKAQLAAHTRSAARAGDETASDDDPLGDEPSLEADLPANKEPAESDGAGYEFQAPAFETAEESPLGFTAALMSGDEDGAVPAAPLQRQAQDFQAGDGAIWHEEVSTAPDYVPPVVDEDELDEFEHEGPGGDFDAELMHSRSDDGHSDEDLSDLAAAFGFTGEAQADEAETDETGVDEIGADQTGSDEIGAVAPPPLEGYDSLGITMPKTREKQDAFVDRAYAEDAGATEIDAAADEDELLDEPARGDDPRGGEILPFPAVGVDVSSPPPDVDGPPHVPPQMTQPPMTPPPLNAAPVPPGPPIEGAPDGAGARGLGPKGAAGLRPMPGARLMPAAPVPGGGVPPVAGDGIRPHPRNGARPLPPASQQMQSPDGQPDAGVGDAPRPPMPPQVSGVVPGGMSPVPMNGAMRRPEAPAPGNDGVVTGMLPRSPDDLYASGDDKAEPEVKVMGERAAVDRGGDAPVAVSAEADDMPAEMRKAPAQMMPPEMSNEGEEPRVDDAASGEDVTGADETPDSQPLGQYLARKRGLDTPATARGDEPEQALPPAAPPPLHGGAMPPRPMPPGMNGPRGPQGLADAGLKNGATVNGAAVNGLRPVANGAVPPGRPPLAPGQPLPPGQMPPQMPSGAPPGQPVAQGRQMPPPGHPGRPIAHPAAGLPMAGEPFEAGADRRRTGPEEPRDEHGVSDGFRMRARKFAESLERSFVEDDD